MKFVFIVDRIDPKGFIFGGAKIEKIGGSQETGEQSFYTIGPAVTP